MLSFRYMMLKNIAVLKTQRIWPWSALIVIGIPEPVNERVPHSGLPEHNSSWLPISSIVPLSSTNMRSASLRGRKPVGYQYS